MHHWDRLDARVALTGGVVDLRLRGAEEGPSILTGNGFEWLAWLLVEPARLWRRYVVGNSLFLARVLERRLIRDGAWT